MQMLDIGVCLPGFKAGGLRNGKFGVSIILAENECSYCGVYTRNSVKAAPIRIMLEHEGPLRGLLGNSGNANCCNLQGVDDALEIRQAAAHSLGVAPRLLGVASTGIIGRRIDAEKYSEEFQKAAGKIGESPEDSDKAAKGLMTTDTYPKMTCHEEEGLMVGGICKGAGMIDPSMATMLCFLTTNADIKQKQMQKILSEVVDETFNMVVTDGDMSTNDTVMLISDNSVDANPETFRKVLHATCLELAKMIAFDGEGATKKITVTVEGAETEKDARKAVLAIARSNLVKTAFYGCNPNWGRIMGAVGSVLDVDWTKITITYKSGARAYNIVEKGRGNDLEPAEQLLKENELTLIVDLDMGGKSATGYTCDLTQEYIRINAEYS